MIIDSGSQYNIFFSRSTGSSVRASAHILKPLEGDLLESDADVGKHAYAFRRIQGVLHQLSHRRVQRLGRCVKPRYRFVLREKLRGALLLGYLRRADHLDSSPPHHHHPPRSARLRTDRQPRAPFPFAGLCLFFFLSFFGFPREKPEKLDAVLLEPLRAYRTQEGRPAVEASARTRALRCC